MAGTAAKSVMTCGILTMAIHLSRLTTGTMNVNACHEKTSKVCIVYQTHPLDTSPIILTIRHNCPERAHDRFSTCRFNYSVTQSLQKIKAATSGYLSFQLNAKAYHRNNPDYGCTIQAA
ncbi:hypothetical protein K5U31_001606 [Salmonella enterica]|nr:hypothetical protein [Salmonella enterica]